MRVIFILIQIKWLRYIFIFTLHILYIKFINNPRKHGKSNFRQLAWTKERPKIISRQNVELFLWFIRFNNSDSHANIIQREWTNVKVISVKFIRGHLIVHLSLFGSQIRTEQTDCNLALYYKIKSFVSNYRVTRQGLRLAAASRGNLKFRDTIPNFDTEHWSRIPHASLEIPPFVDRLRVHARFLRLHTSRYGPRWSIRLEEARWKRSQSISGGRSSRKMQGRGSSLPRTVAPCAACNRRGTHIGSLILPGGCLVASLHLDPGPHANLHPGKVHVSSPLMRDHVSLAPATISWFTIIVEIGEGFPLPLCGNASREKRRASTCLSEFSSVWFSVLRTHCRIEDSSGMASALSQTLQKIIYVGNQVKARKKILIIIKTNYCWESLRRHTYMWITRLK